MLLAVQVFSILFYGLMTDSQLSHVIFNCLGLISAYFGGLDNLPLTRYQLDWSGFGANSYWPRH